MHQSIDQSQSRYRVGSVCAVAEWFVGTIATAAEGHADGEIALARGVGRFVDLIPRPLIGIAEARKGAVALGIGEDHFVAADDLGLAEHGFFYGLS